MISIMYYQYYDERHLRITCMCIAYLVKYEIKKFKLNEKSCVAWYKANYNMVGAAVALVISAMHEKSC